MKPFSRTLEEATALARKIQEAAKDGERPAKARWMEVHWNRMKLYELFIDEVHDLSYLQIKRLALIVKRVRNIENVLDPSADHFTEKMV